MSDPVAETRALLAARTPGGWVIATMCHCFEPEDCDDHWEVWADPDYSDKQKRTIRSGVLIPNNADDLALVAAAPRLLAALADRVETLQASAYDVLKVHGPWWEAGGTADEQEANEVAVHDALMAFWAALSEESTDA